MEPPPADQFKFVQAAVLVEDALRRRKLPHRLDRDTLPLYRLHASVPFQMALKLVVYMNLALVFVENPGANLLLPVAVTLSLELAFQLVYIGDMLLRYKFLEPGLFFRDKKNPGMAAIVALTLVDMVVYLVVQVHFGVRYPRFSRVLRVYYFVYYHQSVRMSFRDLRKALPQIGDAFFMLAAFLLFATAFFMVFFYQRAGYETYWFDFGQAFTSCYVLMTTENFPDIMMPSYSDNQWNSAPFVVFLIMVKALMLNVLMAVIFSTYRSQMRDEVRTLIKFEHERMNNAFHIIVGEQGAEMGVTDWQRLFKVLRPKYSLRKVQLLFQIIDEDDDGVISKTEFARTIELLDMTIKPADEYRNLWEKLFPNFYHLRPVNALRRFVQHRLFQYLGDIAIIANVVTILVMFGSLNVSGAEDDESQDPGAYVDHVHISELVFFLVFVVEAVLKVFALGPRKFWKSSWNKFDVVTLLLILISFILVAEGFPRIIVRVVMLLRVVRMFRIFAKFKRYDTTMRTMGALFPVFISNSALMMCTYYVFIIVGVEAWGGLITPDNPALLQTDYWQTGYYPNTFNTFGEGIIMMITLTIVNNWNTTVTVFIALSGRWVWVFFIASHVTCVILIENVFAAFVIEFFFLQLELERKPRHDVIEQRIIVLSSRGRISTHGSAASGGGGGHGGHSSLLDSRVAEWIVKQPTTQRHTQRLMFADEIAELEEEMDNQGEATNFRKSSKAYLMEDLRLLSSAFRSSWRAKQPDPGDITAVSGSIAQLGQATALSANRPSNSPDQREIRLNVVQAPSKNPTFRDL